MVSRYIPTRSLFTVTACGERWQTMSTDVRERPRWAGHGEPPTKVSQDNADPGWGWAALGVLTPTVAVRKVPICRKDTDVFMFSPEMVSQTAASNFQLFFCKFVTTWKTHF